MRRRWKSKGAGPLAVVVLAAVSLAQTGADLIPPDVRRVGDRLACLCGICKNTIGTCPMLGCHSASPGREKIAKRLAEGATDQQIVDEFVREQGKHALSAPPGEGVFITAWVMPFVALSFGLVAVVWFIRRSRRPVPAVVTEGAPDSKALERFKDQIDKDLARLE